MELLEVRTIDDLGRLLIPKSIRDCKGWGEGTKISIFIQNSVVMLAKCEGQEGQEEQGEQEETD